LRNSTIKTFLGVLGLAALIFTGGCPGGCSKKDDVKFTEADMTKFQEDLVVPTELWGTIQAVFKPMALDPEGQAAKEAVEEEKKEVKGEHGETKSGAKGMAPDGATRLMKKRPQLDPIGLTVEMVEKTQGVLGGQNHRLKYPVGGSLLDLRYFVPGSVNGTFFFKLEFEQEMDPKELKVYYLSNAKMRQVGGAQIGNGCDRYYDISDYWKKQMKAEGLVLNTVNNRHVSILSGTFFFVVPVKGKLRITHITIRDSRHRDLVCNSN
jgi:hypothetical protein